ncbi:sensor domain-containing diguanylate cyclase [Paenibacillus marchantiophytorum]|uniref:Sensor domain-containing diguanylate cyclase n=1 Tax=Paenibacillus marchantiophytorum TaxID=1619310 RepID=A0ABQ1EVK4_9BACL|nr:sensor domain-containing diguanylate cyclase [Paenibacillus marchantiophytorum]GFZ89327.1 sensor domain-containing diguanylate cyclase [Paenibacillus marchantiophytorum]
MVRRGDFKLRHLVNAFVFISVITTLSVSIAISYHNEKKSLIRMTFELNKIYADKVAETVDGLFLGLKQGLKVTGAYLQKDLNRPDMFEQLELFRHNHSSLNTVTLVNRAGIITQTSPYNKDLIGKKIGPDIDKLFIQQRPIISEPYFTTTNYLSVSIIQPLFNEYGEFIGALGGTIHLHETNMFNTILGDKMRGEDGSYFFVVSSEGTLIYHPEPSRIGEKVVENPVVAHLLEGKSGVQRLTNTKGVDMLASFTYMKESRWGIVAQTPANIVLKATRQLVMQVLIVVIPILLAFMLVIYTLIRKMSEPLVRLANYAAKLSTNNLEHEEPPRIHSWMYEANKLHKAFSLAVSHLRTEFDDLSHDAQTDPLTGLYNRRTLELFMTNLFSQEKRFSILVLDIDNFKHVNDSYGHEFGDNMLQFLAESLQKSLGKSGVCFRYGGEEFVILLPGTSLQSALTRAEMLRKTLEETAGPGGKHITVSIGVASFPETTSVTDKLFGLADKALYQAKSLGRNRVELAKKEPTLDC